MNQPPERLIVNKITSYKNNGWLTNPDTLEREWHVPVTTMRIDLDYSYYKIDVPI